MAAKLRAEFRVLRQLSLRPLVRRMSRLQKKLRQIRVIEDKASWGSALDSSEKEKLNRKEEVVAELERLQKVCYPPGLCDLPDGLLLDIMDWLDVPTLRDMDMTCSRLYNMNVSPSGPWRVRGVAAFAGMVLKQDGFFDPLASATSTRSQAGLQELHAKMVSCWKKRYHRFLKRLPSFSHSFGDCGLITYVDRPDEVIYLKCQFRTDVLLAKEDGVYIEVEILANADNLSLAIVDFSSGGRSSVTFSPETGAVIREMKVREAPRKVEGSFIQPLPMIKQGERFRGWAGLYLCQGKLTFYRRLADLSLEHDEVALQRTSQARGSASSRAAKGQMSSSGWKQQPQLPEWETTGHVCDLTWAHGHCLEPCIAFRNEGPYKVRVTALRRTPPVHPESQTADSLDSKCWESMDWDAETEDAADIGDMEEEQVSRRPGGSGTGEEDIPPLVEAPSQSFAASAAASSGSLGCHAPPQEETQPAGHHHKQGSRSRQRHQDRLEGPHGFRRR